MLAGVSETMTAQMLRVLDCKLQEELSLQVNKVSRAARLKTRQAMRNHSMLAQQGNALSLQEAFTHRVLF